MIIRFQWFLAYLFLSQLVIKWLFKFPPHPLSASAVFGKIRSSKIRVEMIKTSMNSVYPDLWPPRVSRLQDLTVVRQYVYHVTLRNVCEFTKRLVKSGWVWSITLSILLSMNGEIVSMFVIAQLANISIKFIAGSWKTKQLDKVSAKVLKMWIKCVLCVIYIK